jgi:hypothetical protein
MDVEALLQEVGAINLCGPRFKRDVQYAHDYLFANKFAIPTTFGYLD